jgi:hypothetical protein
MSALFLIAGYFVVGSYKRKGFWRFTKDRLVRLGIPTLVYMAIIYPAIYQIELGTPWFEPGLDFPALVDRFLTGNSVMWFTEVLLVFSILYGLSRVLIAHKRPKEPASQESRRRKKGTIFSIKNLVLLILLIAILAFLIRIEFNRTDYWFGIKFGNLAAYTILFIVGIFIQKYNLLSAVSYKTGRRWLIAGIIVGCIGWTLLYGTTPANRLDELHGGMYLLSAAYSLWESFIAVSMCIGLLVLFREKFNQRNSLSQAMADASFAVYMSHFFIIIAMVKLFLPLPLSPIVKWILLSLLCVPLCFTVAHFVIKKIPLLKKVL